MKFLILILFASTTVLAEEVHVFIPTLETVTTQRETASNLPDGSLLEFSAGSFSPSSLVVPSRIPNTTAAGSALPYFGVNYISSPMVSGQGGDLSWKIGAGFDSLSRSVGGSLFTAETLSLIQARGGFEFSPRVLRTSTFSTRVSATGLPSLLLSKRSAYDDGENALGIAGELALGVDTHLGALWKSTSLIFTVEGSGQVGTIDGGSLNGLGVGAGFRVLL